MDDPTDFLMTPVPTAMRPLLGLTVLAVEDSRFASEALRLLCLRSGARIRRADSLASARRHLGVYRPSVAIVDLGLPDGIGDALIADLAQASVRVAVLLGSSGDPGGETRAMAAGADGFLAKPIADLAHFQDAILQHLPPDRRPCGLRVLPQDRVMPDRVAYHDDLAHVAAVLRGSAGAGAIDYVTQFLGGLARSADDGDLDSAVRALAAQRQAGGSLKSGLARLNALVQDRLATQAIL